MDLTLEERDGPVWIVVDGDGNRFHFTGNLHVDAHQHVILPIPRLALPVGVSGDRSSEWRTVAKHFIADHPTCIGCGGNDFLQVHHKQPFHIHPELELKPANLRTLCMNPNRLCHFRIGHSFDWHAWNPHVDEDAAAQLLRIQHRKYNKCDAA